MSSQPPGPAGRRGRPALSAAQRLVRCAVFVCALAAALGRPAGPARAQEASPDRFLILVPSGFETEFIGFWTAYEGELNRAYDFYAKLYGVEPPLPVYIHVYAARADLYHENLLVPPVPDEGTHTHLGAREISLIAPFPTGFLASQSGLDVVLWELNSVFLSTLGHNNLPAGLELGISQYVVLREADRQTAADRVQQAQQAVQLYTWRALLSNPIIYSDVAVGQPQAFALSAYLVDTYGFPSVVALVKAIGENHSLDDALVAVFGEPMDRLARGWQAYLPAFLEGRWRYNALYAFDLEPFRAALKSGAYAQVARSLAAVIPFLESTGQAAAVTESKALIATAQQGIDAGNLVLQTRGALEAGLYERTLELVAQSRAAYAALGNDSREAELAAYAARARHVLDLRAQLADAAARANAGQLDPAEADLIALVPQLEAVGDTDNAALAQNLIASIYIQRRQAADERALLAQRSLYALLAVLGVVALHQTGRLIYRRWRKPAPSVL